jgi:hypothetical protein
MLNAIYLDTHPNIKAYVFVSFASFGAMIASYFYNLIAVLFIPFICYVLARFRDPEMGSDILGNTSPVKTYKPIIEFFVIVVTICSGVVLLELAPILVSQLIWSIFTFVLLPISIYISGVLV